MLTEKTTRDLPIWPSGIARFSDGILEVTTSDDKTSYWVEPQHESALHELVEAVEAARASA
jgi:hypothetical protein